MIRAISIAFALVLALAAPAHGAATKPPPARKPLPRAFVSRGACPFECCVYRRCAARRPLPVFAREQGSGVPAFTIAAGDSFDALTGNVHVPRTGLARVLRAFQFGSGADRVHLVPGDRLALLDEGGEGTTHVWIDGKESWLELDALADTSAHGGPRARPYVRILRRGVSAWWVHVRALDGREGWFQADAPGPDGARTEDFPFDNADDCG